MAMAGLATLLLAFVVGMAGVSGTSSTSASPPQAVASPACQMVLDLWCNTDAPCVDVITRDGFALPLVARFDLQKAGIWRCYSPSALDGNLSHYAGGKAFCSHKELADVLAVCEGRKPGPYPLPPAQEGPGGGVGAGCDSPFFAGAPNATRPLDNARDKTEYRIPVVMKIPDTQVVVAFAENRGGGSGDSGRHQLAMARSTDNGATFGPVVNIYNDSTTTVDGLNLGGAVWDNKQKRLSVLFNECFHLNAVGHGGCGPVGQTLQIDSADNGMTWGVVINHTTSLVAQGIKQLNPGPGTGIQLQYQKDTTKNGRLVLPGWGSLMSDPRGTSTRAIVLVSDASPDTGSGTADNNEPLSTWRAVLVPPQKPENVPNELQCAELPDGTIVLNVRSGNHKLRLLSTSSDGGDSWSSLALSESMGEQAICQGSMISVGSALFYSHPFHADGTRTDGWIKFSLDKGATWYPWAQVSPNSFGYSGLTLLSRNSTRLSLGVVWEGSDGIEWKAVDGFMPGADV